MMTKTTSINMVTITDDGTGDRDDDDDDYDDGQIHLTHDDETDQTTERR